MLLSAVLIVLRVFPWLRHQVTETRVVKPSDPLPIIVFLLVALKHCLLLTQIVISVAPVVGLRRWPTALRCPISLILLKINSSSRFLSNYGFPDIV